MRLPSVRGGIRFYGGQEGPHQNAKTDTEIQKTKQNAVTRKKNLKKSTAQL